MNDFGHPPENGNYNACQDVGLNKANDMVYQGNNTYVLSTQSFLLSILYTEYKKQNKKVFNWSTCMAKFKYLKMKVNNQNFIHEEMKSRLNLGNTCYQFRIFCLAISYLKP
jgi:hypothetical protein